MANSADPDEMSIMLHLIWVFTVFQSTHLGVIIIQRVKHVLLWIKHSSDQESRASWPSGIICFHNLCKFASKALPSLLVVKGVKITNWTLFRLLILKNSAQKAETQTDMEQTQLDTLKLSEAERDRLEKKKKVSHSCCGKNCVILMAPITVKVIYFCGRLKCFSSFLTNIVVWMKQ